MMSIQDVYKVTFSDGRTVLCGPEHLWLTKANDDVRYRVRSLKTMMVDYFAYVMNMKIQSIQISYSFK